MCEANALPLRPQQAYALTIKLNIKNFAELFDPSNFDAVIEDTARFVNPTKAATRVVSEVPDLTSSTSKPFFQI